MSAPEFILMLTRDDVTVPDAGEVYAEVRAAALRHVGFKDIGLPFDRLRALAEAIRGDGRQVVLEVVSECREDELRSARAGLALGVDYLMGGTHADDVTRILAGSPVRYCPFPGTVVGHPSRLRGTVEEIADSARRLAATEGVCGLDLLAYRYDGDVEALVRSVVAAAGVPVIAAGSIGAMAQIGRLAALGVWGFTVGTAIFERRFAGGDPSLRAQVEAVLEICRRLPQALDAGP
ncbi:MAG: 4-hydroxythreonine-4-phosphate dehydrogenase [Armatimonadota bacterium]|nr:4-hydroxythreonine-4-phosphate dehydrogenase [Armatimonadota bacterium]MDR7518277.1 4-hydroxythreonine-4-phosphate dehydrogenase [Armatimonadota bacterium]MDR7548701.1 4-hydroxythreonine-4-phosphate dehydrogenase [Armatimonadota bacterium]